MSNESRDVKLYVNDIIEAIQKIESYTNQMSYENFLKDEKTQDAVLRNLEVIGEATKNIPNTIKDKYTDVNWKEATKMRDKVIHGYFGVSLFIIWETIQNDLPGFKQEIISVSKNI